MLNPRTPLGLNLPLSFLTLALDVDEEIDEDIRIVHPREREDNAGMVVCQFAGQPLNNARDENGKSENQVRCRVSFR
jgi:hypothetical protein